RDLSAEQLPGDIEEMVLNDYLQYMASLRDDRRLLLERFEPVDIAVKVVGVGSVGTRCFVVLFQGRDSGDPLFLQVKEAGRSVLEQHLVPTPYDNQGQRVVAGQRLMQATSDVFLGWSRDREPPDFYWRQLRDWKGLLDLHREPEDLERY